MTIYQSMKYALILLMVSVLLIAMPFALTVIAANYPLEIINIKPAGTGSPSIPSTNRIFRAYPGIEYNIRAAVIGGAYPYSYSLSNAPPGMTINSRTGEIVWPNPQSSVNNIQLTVVDSESTQVQATWSITVGTSGFLFVNASYSGTEIGSITQPYSSLANLFNNQTNNPTAIVYFRAGTYSMPSGYGSFGNRPHNWIGYPGESVTINMQQRQDVWTEHSPYFDRITFTNMLNHGIHLYGPRSYQTIRRCVYDGITTNTSANNNQGMIPVLASEGSNGRFTVIQDNEFKNFTGSQAIGSIYRMEKFLIENNHIHKGGYSYLNPFRQGIGPKYNIMYATIRGNKIVMDEYHPVDIFAAGTSSYFDICFNLLVAPNTSSTALSHYYPKNVWAYRNTIIGNINHEFNCSQSEGPFAYDGNVIVNNNSGITGATGCRTDIDNLKGSVVGNYVDSSNEYKLVSGQSQYVGSRGWQLSDGSTPITTTTTDTTPPSVPTNLTATAISSSQINLSWTASTDNVGVTGYRIYRCQGTGCTPTNQIATSTTNSFSDAGLSASTTYVYRVAAYDAAGIVSGQSSSASATTPADTTPPSTPTNLTATAVSNAQINLSWTASTDNVGVTGYRIYRCQGTTCTPTTQVATSITNSYQDTVLSASTTYRYRVRAIDAAGNISSYSSTASATTQNPPDITPPAPPTGFTIIR